VVPSLQRKRDERVLFHLLLPQKEKHKGPILRGEEKKGESLYQVLIITLEGKKGEGKRKRARSSFSCTSFTFKGKLDFRREVGRADFHRTIDEREKKEEECVLLFCIREEIRESAAYREGRKGGEGKGETRGARLLRPCRGGKEKREVESNALSRDVSQKSREADRNGERKRKKKNSRIRAPDAQQKKEKKRELIPVLNFEPEKPDRRRFQAR